MYGIKGGDCMNIILVDGQITENFNLKEFACKANNELLINSKVIDHIERLQVFREWYRRPMVIISGYRTEAYNAQVGGSPKSYHMQNLATDFSLPSEFYGYTDERQLEFLNNVKRKWIDLCQQVGLGGGVGWYDTFIHLDSRPRTATSHGYSFWDYRTKK